MRGLRLQHRRRGRLPGRGFLLQVCIGLTTGEIPLMGV